jgi:TRAP-type mannitol/chloroaromatic compound transport system permease small subunit
MSMQSDIQIDATRPDAPLPLRTSERLRRGVDFVGRCASWLLVPLVLITVIDVVARKLTWQGSDGVQGVQIWLVSTFGNIFESTVLQELEWHFHTALFALVLGFGTIYNTHVRVDLVRDHLRFRRKAWLEFLGLSCFMIPYLLLLIYFCVPWVIDSFAVGEVSASTVGLSRRWIIKGILVTGLIVATVAGIAVWLQVVYVLWGPQDARFKLMTLEWPEEAGTKVEGKERIKLEDTPDPVLEAPVALEEAALEAARAGATKS